LLWDADFDARAGSFASEVTPSGFGRRRRGIRSGVRDDDKDEQGRLLEGKRKGG